MLTSRDLKALPGPRWDIRDNKYIYAIERSDGAVKVGITMTPQQRMTKHESDARLRGYRLLSVYGVPTSRPCYAGERELIKRLRRCANPVKGETEWFTGLPYLGVVTLVRQMSRNTDKRSTERAS